MNIQEKINALGYWLICNPNHPNYQTVLRDKRELEKQIETIKN